MTLNLHQVAHSPRAILLGKAPYCGGEQNGRQAKGCPRQIESFHEMERFFSVITFSAIHCCFGFVLVLSDGFGACSMTFLLLFAIS